MAGKDIVLKFKALTKTAQKEIAGLNTQLKHADKIQAANAKSTVRRQAMISAAFKGTGIAMAGVGVAIAGVVAISVNEYKKFETKIAEVHTLLSKEPEVFADIKAGVFGLPENAKDKSGLSKQKEPIGKERRAVKAKTTKSPVGPATGETASVQGKSKVKSRTTTKKKKTAAGKKTGKKHSSSETEQCSDSQVKKSSPQSPSEKKGEQTLKSRIDSTLARVSTDALASCSLPAGPTQ